MSSEHLAIIEERVFSAVQRQLQENQRAAKPTRRRASANQTAALPAQVGNLPKPLPRIARLLALALKFEGLIHQGVVKDYAANTTTMLRAASRPDACLFRCISCLPKGITL